MKKQFSFFAGAALGVFFMGITAADAGPALGDSPSVPNTSKTLAPSKGGIADDSVRNTGKSGVADDSVRNAGKSGVADDSVRSTPTLNKGPTNGTPPVTSPYNPK